MFFVRRYCSGVVVLWTKLGGCYFPSKPDNEYLHHVNNLPRPQGRLDGLPDAGAKSEGGGPSEDPDGADFYTTLKHGVVLWGAAKRALLYSLQHVQEQRPFQWRTICGCRLEL